MSIKKAIAAGHICLDITPAFKSKEEKNIKDLFRPVGRIAAVLYPGARHAGIGESRVNDPSSGAKTG